VEYEVVDRLSEIHVPVLFLCGRYDDATPEATSWYHQHLPESQMVVFEESAHLPHFEETERYLRVVDRFLTGVEATEDALGSTVKDIQATKEA
jgi:proline iminopeptidase